MNPYIRCVIVGHKLFFTNGQIYFTFKSLQILCYTLDISLKHLVTGQASSALFLIEWTHFVGWPSITTRYINWAYYSWHSIIKSPIWQIVQQFCQYFSPSLSSRFSTLKRWNFVFSESASLSLKLTPRNASVTLHTSTCFCTCLCAELLLFTQSPPSELFSSVQLVPLITLSLAFAHTFLTSTGTSLIPNKPIRDISSSILVPIHFLIAVHDCRP